MRDEVDEDIYITETL